VSEHPETVRCPTCRRITAWAGNPDRPFCSARCRLQDFGNWAAERYRIPGETVPSEAAAAEGPGEDEE
jgi:endogenous inhibitor of DNA gyrase (YacG/DUF329 family)